MRVVQIKDIDTALRVYYTYPELSNAQIRELFGNIAGSTISKYKQAVRAIQAEREVKTSQLNTINTEIAYEVWGINVADLEKRRAKLIKLGLSA